MTLLDWRPYGLRGVKVQKGLLMLRAPWFIAISNCAYALCTRLAQPSLLGICLATAWQVRPLITSAFKCNTATNGRITKCASVP